MEELKEKERQRRRRLNIAWIICGGWACSVFWLVIGGLFYITILGRGAGRQCVRIAKYAIWPYEIQTNAFIWNAPLANFLWWFPFGVLFFAMMLPPWLTTILLAIYRPSPTPIFEYFFALE